MYDPGSRGTMEPTTNQLTDRPIPCVVLQTCSGAVACQLMDILHGPGTVNMKKVDFNVRNEWEYVNNYKELQKAFTKKKVDRAFNVSQLSKGKRQDSIEFMQWFKGYWDSVTNGDDVCENYDALERRRLCKTGDWKRCSVRNNNPVARKEARPTPVMQKKAPVSCIEEPRSIKADRSCRDEEYNMMRTQVDSMMEKITELKLKVDTAERERDFYFDKLRDIEIMCQAPELADIPVLRIVEQVLYAADSEEAKKIMLDAEKSLCAQLVPGGEVALDEADPVQPAII